jgi:hypothetical protein
MDEEDEPFKNPALQDKIKRLKAEKRLFTGDFLPRHYEEIIAYLEETYGISEKTARHDIVIHTKLKLVVNDKGILRLADPSLSLGGS